MLMFQEASIGFFLTSRFYRFMSNLISILVENLLCSFSVSSGGDPKFFLPFVTSHRAHSLRGINMAGSVVNTANGTGSGVKIVLAKVCGCFYGPAYFC